VLIAVVPRRAAAHEGGKIRGTCVAKNASGRATVTLIVENVDSEPVRNLIPADITGTGTGDATFFVQTTPRASRELLPGKRAEFLWKGRFYGNGFIDLTVEVGGEFPGASETTGLVNCNRVAVGNPDGEPPTATPDSREPTTPPTNRPPPTATTHRPSPTPNTRPTRTPRDSTPTRRETSASTRLPTQPRSTRTPVAHQTVEPTQPRPTRTPVLQATTGPRPTRTPNVPPTREPTQPRPTRTPLVQATREPTQPRPTRTPIMLATRPPRPTRTPHIPPPTPTIPSDPGGGLQASCSLRRTDDVVAITLLVENHSGIDLGDVRASTLQLDAEGGVVFFDRSGPRPISVSLLRNGAAAAFEWSGRLSPDGTVGFSVFATASSPGGPLQTALTDCGVTGVDGGSFDPASFNGECSISPGEDGEISVKIRNGSRETLTNVETAFVSQTTDGSATVLDLSGPAPRMANQLASGGRREFLFGASFLGNGQVTMHFVGRGTRANSQRIETAEFECTAAVGGQGGSLPDLGVDEGELRASAVVESQQFGPDDCAVAEGCVDGVGVRELLRFNTVTPNFGPGDVFLGDPLGNPEFVYAECHRHYHFENYANYRLLDMSGSIVARGHKQAFCLVDLWQVPGLGGDPRPQFPTCEFQGISAGWADVYHRGLDCQWVDVTGVPSGRYILEVEINPARVIMEHNYQNNVGRAEVVIP
jgi:hypothetical protein